MRTKNAAAREKDLDFIGYTYKNFEVVGEEVHKKRAKAKPSIASIFPGAVPEEAGTSASSSAGAGAGAGAGAVMASLAGLRVGGNREFRTRPFSHREFARRGGGRRFRAHARERIVRGASFTNRGGGGGGRRACLGGRALGTRTDASMTRREGELGYNT